MTKPKGNLPPAEDNKPKKPRLKKNEGSNVAESQKTFVGQEVHGIVDGSFDAGYLLTVKVGDSPLVLRGLVFMPGQSVPLSKGNDVAPTIKGTVRDQQVVLPKSLQSSTGGGESSLAATTQAPAAIKQEQANEGLGGSIGMPAVEQGYMEPDHAAIGLTSEKEVTGHTDVVADDSEDMVEESVQQSGSVGTNL